MTPDTLEKAQQILRSVIDERTATVATAVEIASQRQVARADARAAVYMMLSSGEVDFDDRYHLRLVHR
jgi:hypothetical protein